MYKEERETSICFGFFFSLPRKLAASTKRESCSPSSSFWMRSLTFGSTLACIVLACLSFLPSLFSGKTNGPIDNGRDACSPCSPCSPCLCSPDNSSHFKKEPLFLPWRKILISELIRKKVSLFLCLPLLLEEKKGLFSFLSQLFILAVLPRIKTWKKGRKRSLWGNIETVARQKRGWENEQVAKPTVKSGFVLSSFFVSFLFFSFGSPLRRLACHGVVARVSVPEGERKTARVKEQTGSGATRPPGKMRRVFLPCLN